MEGEGKECACAFNFLTGAHLLSPKNLQGWLPSSWLSSFNYRGWFRFFCSVNELTKPLAGLVCSQTSLKTVSMGHLFFETALSS